MSELSKELTSNQRVIFWLSCIIGIGLVVRFFYFPNEVPISTDGYFSFVYAIKTVFNGGLPIGLNVVNSGWSNFLSFIFVFLEKTDPLQLMNIQRCVSIVISTVTVIPIFFILKRFVDIKWALFGSFLLVMEPRLLLISLEGINYSLFFFLFSLSIALFLKKTNISLILCYICLAITTLVRYEALLMVIPFSIMYFVRFRERKYILRFFVLIILMIAILIPMGMMREHVTQDICYQSVILGDMCGKDGFTSEILGNIEFFQKYIISGEKLNIEEGDESYKIHEEIYDKPDRLWFVDIFSISSDKLIKFLGFVFIPYFVFFVLFNLINRIYNKEIIKWNFNSVTILFTTMIMLIPAIYGYIRDIDEIRYILILIPLICILSISFRESIRDKFSQDKRILIILIVFCVVLSIAFIETQKNDYEYDVEVFGVSKEVVLLTNVTNTFERSGYIKTAVLFRDWPELPEHIPSNGKIKHEFLKIRTIDYKNIEEFIDENRKNKLRYIMVDQNEKLFDDLRESPTKFPYLKKIFDSSDLNYINNFKIFKIDYDEYDLDSFQ